ncbi:MAG: hypothetical protein ABWY49_00210 [Rhizobium sp.]
MLYKLELLLLGVIDRYLGLERLALRAGLSAKDARRVARWKP